MHQKRQKHRSNIIIHGESACGEPVYGEPVHAEPVYGEPVYGEPVDGEPVHGESVHAESSASRLAIPLDKQLIVPYTRLTQGFPCRQLCGLL